uniref:RING-type domain-containing protein n=1 Tax=Kalanchoe fedtschenkoi TaxID=63787 RepID=A0A7N0ZSM6_KALFE
MGSSTFSTKTFDSCHLTRMAYTVKIKEGHPMWTKITQDSYLVEVRRTRRNFLFNACLHGYRQLQLAGPAEEQSTRSSIGFAAAQHELADPSQFVTKLLEELRLHLRRSERRYLTDVIHTFRSKVDPGTTTMAVIDFSLCHTEVKKRCVKKAEIGMVPGLSKPSTHDFPVEGRIRRRVEEMWWSSWMLKRSEALKHSSNGVVRVRYDGAGDETCSVCLNEFQRGHEIARTACCHNFHKTCITVWISKVRNCPLCRSLVAI